MGAIVGFVALASPWVDWTTADGIHPINTTVFHVIYSGPNGALFLGGLLFIIGAIVAFGSPVGGIFQFAGASLFFVGFLETTQGRLPSMIGFYLAMISGIIVTASFIRPIGIGYGDAKPVWDDRKYMYSKMTVAWLKNFIMDILHPQW